MVPRLVMYRCGCSVTTFGPVRPVCIRHKEPVIKTQETDVSEEIKR